MAGSRAIADWMLALSENSAQRLYSMSAQIHHERNDYYDILERTQKETLDITPWMKWFLGRLGRAFGGTETTLAGVLRKAHFWERHARVTLNPRQILMLNKMLDGFDGKLTTVKWAKSGEPYPSKDGDVNRHDTAPKPRAIALFPDRRAVV